jgi:enolase
MTQNTATKIEKIIAREIFDSRKKPTLEVTVFAGEHNASFAVPSGASTGVHEAHELRDADPTYMAGNGVKKAIENVNGPIAQALAGVDITNQKEIDRILCELDGTTNKDRLGGNATIGASVACAKAAAKVKKIETFEHIRDLAFSKGTTSHLLFINLINGGKHADSGLSFQEYQIIPQTHDVSSALQMAEKIQKSVGETLISKYDQKNLTLGDEGGFAPHLNSSLRPLEILTEAISTCGLNDSVLLGLDIAASSFFESETNSYLVDGEKISAADLAKKYQNMLTDFKIFSIEDPFQEEDFASFSSLLESASVKNTPNNSTLIIGDDLTVTNTARLKKAIEQKSVNALIIKPNQIGTLSETLDTIQLAHENNIKCIVSHRSGDTMDDFIADLAYGAQCFGLKAGEPHQPERKVKYDRLVQITKH